MPYLRKQVEAHDEDLARVNLSVRQDMRTAPLGTPASEGRVSPEPQCDWCADEVPLYVYAASQLSNGQPLPPGTTYCWRWMACAKCARLVENGNWDALERRVRARFKQFFAGKLEELARAEGRSYRPIPESLMEEAVKASMQQFHDYAIRTEESK